MALKEKEAALLKLAQMQKEVDNLSGGPLLHVIRRVQDLKTAPMGALKTIEWQLRKDLQEVEKVISFNVFIIKGCLMLNLRNFFTLFVSSRENFVKSLSGRKVLNGDLAHIFEEVTKVKNFLKLSNLYQVHCINEDNSFLSGFLVPKFKLILKLVNLLYVCHDG